MKGVDPDLQAWRERLEVLLRDIADPNVLKALHAVVSGYLLEHQTTDPNLGPFVDSFEKALEKARAEGKKRDEELN